MVEHHAESYGKALRWWSSFASKKPEQFAEMRELSLAAGFYNHMFIPTTVSTKMFCVWEAKEGKTVEVINSESFFLFLTLRRKLFCERSELQDRALMSVRSDLC